MQAETADNFFAASQSLDVQSCIAAGDSMDREYDPALAVEIMTGAPIPHSLFTAVIRIEDVQVTRDENGRAQYILLKKPVVNGENIRRAGEDFQVGQKVADVGTLLNENHVLAFATLGLARVLIYVPPRVAVASTGKELVPFATKTLAPGKIRNSTSVYLAAY